MKILRVVSSGWSEGGAEAGIVQMQPVLEARGHEVRTLASDARPDRPHFNHYSFPSPQGWARRFKYTWNAGAYRALKRAIGEFRPDIVHLHTLGAASPAVLYALRGQPTVATVHGPEGYTRDLIMWNQPKTDFRGEVYARANLTTVGKLRYAYYRFVNYPLYRLGFRNVDRIVTISSFIRDTMGAQGMPSMFIPNGVELFEPVPFGAGALPHTVVFAGRLEKVKGVDVALRAVARVVERYPDTRFLIAGVGGDEAVLRTLTAELGITDHVSFVGHLDTRVELRAFYGQSVAVLVPSIWPEVSSRTGIEALSVGRPIIASNVGGLTDWLVPGATGLLVPPGDVGALAEAICTLFADPEGTVRMGADARAKACTYDIARHAAALEGVYRDVLREYGRLERDDTVANAHL